MTPDDQKLANAWGCYRREIKLDTEYEERMLAVCWAFVGFAWAHWNGLARYPWEPSNRPRFTNGGTIMTKTHVTPNGATLTLDDAYMTTGIKGSIRNPRSGTTESGCSW